MARIMHSPIPRLALSIVSTASSQHSARVEEMSGRGARGRELKLKIDNPKYSIQILETRISAPIVDQK